MAPTSRRLACILLALLVSLPAPAALADAPPRPDAPAPAQGAGLRQGQAEESRTIVVDPTVDRFTSLLPWPTNRSLYGMEWRPGGTYGLIVGGGGALFKWDGYGVEAIETGTEEGLFDMDWTADGSKAIIVGNRSTVLVWDAAAGDLTALPFSGSGTVQMFGVAWDPSGAGALIVGDGGYVAYFNGTGMVRIDSNTTEWVYRVAWRPGADYAVAVGDAGVVLELNTTEVRKKVELPVLWNLWRAGWAPDGSYALVAGQQWIGGYPYSLVARYNASGTFDEQAVPGATTAGLRGLQFLPASPQALIVGENSAAFLWNGANLTAIHALDDRTLRGVGWEGDGVHALAVGNRGVLMRWDGSAWAYRSYDPQVGLTSIAWRPQGDYGLVVGYGGYAAKVSLAGPSPVSTGVENDLYDVDWSSDGAFALMCGANGTVLKYDAGTGVVTSIRTWTPGTFPLMGVSVKPGESTALAVGSNGQIWLWTGGFWFDKKLATVGNTLYDVAWRPDGAFAIIVGVSGMALNYTGGQVKTFDPPTSAYNNLYSVSWNKDGSAATVVGTPFYSPVYGKWYDGIEMYDGVLWHLVEGHTNTTYWGCAFTADGETGLAFGARDYVVKYSPREGNAVRTPFSNSLIFLQRAAMDPSRPNVVYFCGGGGYAFRMDVGRFQNRPPKLVISSPKMGSNYTVDTEVVLDTAGTYDPDGDPMSINWWSNVSGFLGAGPTVHVRIDAPGWHRITCYADDGRGHNVSAYVLVRFDVPNYPPVPVIESPLEGAIYTTDDAIVFDANGTTDANGDALTYQWVSQLSGNIGYDQRVEAALPAGIHHIILWVDDGEGGRTAAFVNITVAVANRPPRVYVTAPIEGQRFLPADAIECNASYSTDPDGDALAFSWFANGLLLGQATVLTVHLAEGQYFVKVEADDGHGHTVAVGVNVTVAAPANLPPLLSVAAPANGSQVQGVVNVTGTASDPEGALAWVRVAVGAPSDWTDATGLAAWRYQWDTRALADGLYQLWVEAFDGELTTRAWVQYVVHNPPPPDQPPTVTLTTTVPASVKGALTLEGAASDPDGSVAKVQVRIDADAWVDAVGTVQWNYYLDTRQYDDGPHTLSIRSFDGSKYSDLVTRQFIIDNAGPEDGGGGGTLLLVAGVLLVVVVVAVVAVLVLRGRKQR